MKLTRRRGLIAGAVVIVALALGSGVVASRFGGSPPDLDQLNKAIETEPMTRVADIPATADEPGRGVYVQLTSTGQFCLWDAPSAGSRQKQGGCNSADDPLAGGELSASLAYDGGPAASNVKDARLIGVTSEKVARVEIVMSDGSVRAVGLRSVSLGGGQYRAFGYRFKRADLRSGVGPVAVVAIDKAGAVIDRQTTGFGG